MTNWFAWSSNGHTALGYDAWYVGADLHVDVSLATHWSFSGNSCTLNYSGSWSGSLGRTITRSNPSSGVIWSGVWTQGYNTTATLNFSLSGFYDGSGSTCYLSFNATLGPLAPYAPDTPSVSRVSDSQINLSWGNHPTSERPYANGIGVTRYTNTAATFQVAALANEATSYSDTGLIADRKYAYTVWSTNSAGIGTSGGSAVVYTTPAAPISCAAVKSGSDIVVTWTNTSTYAVENATEVWHAADGVWDDAALITTAAGVTTWTDTAPSTAVTHTYRVRAKSPTDLVSGYSTSNVVILLTRPNAPTGLVQTNTHQFGATLDAVYATTLSFTHNPADSSALTAFEISHQVSSDGGSTWDAAVTTGKLTSAVASQVYAAATWAQNRAVRWQVRTWGSYDGTAPTYSDWSAFSTFWTSTSPVGALSGSATGTSSVLTVLGTYFDAEGSAQAAARWSLRTTGGTTLETITTSDSAKFLTYTFATHVQDATSYVVAHQVQDAAGLWSLEATQNIAITYARPATPTLVVTFQNGSVSGTITNPEGSPATSFNVVYRNGVVITALSGVAPNSGFTDPLPPLDQAVIYTVVAVSDLPSVSLVSDPQSVTTTSNGTVWLNSGPNMVMTASISRAPKLSASSNREKVLVPYDGPEDPTQYSGVAKSFSGDLKGLATAAELDALEELVNRPEPGCYRDSHGRRIFVSLLAIKYEDGAGSAILKAFSISMKRTSYSE